ncbi:MAG: serine/threonine-protein kinase [Vicinamibacterales bacterium]
MSEPLSKERWQRLQSLFTALVDEPADRQRIAVDALTDDDASLAAELGRMLAASGSAAHDLGAVVRAGTAMVDRVTSAPPRAFGRYRVVGEIGRGGMGVVYEAVSDDEFRQRVAVKVAPFAGTPELEQRFALERRILARLEHPNIARFLDAGTEGGHPYVVMEFVDGEPLTAYGRSRALSLAARVALFRPVCAAVQYAHQHLVVHRDLKPSNILVTADGVPKLLDFGIATILEPGRVPGATLGAVTWTPDYASPEQVAGQPVSTQSDVYSLGLVLYELLTGQPAQRADTSSPLALTRSVCEAEPPPPSARAAAEGLPALARQLRGDLDTVVMTAVAKDPARRYGTAAALAEDLDRAMRGEPIHARPHTAWYRTRKFLARNRVAAAAAAIVALSLGVGAAATAYQARRAERRFQQVRALANAFVFDVHDRIATLPGATSARKAIVETALTYLENLREEAGDDASLARELAAAYEKVAGVQGHPLQANLGDPAGALVSYARAAELLSPLSAGGDVSATLALGTVEMRSGQVLRARGDRAGAIAAFERARTLAEQADRVRPDRASVDLLGELYADIARWAMDSREVERANAAAEQAMTYAERLVALDGGASHARDGLATALNALGSARLVSGRLAQAAEAFRRGIELREALVAAEPRNVDLRRGLIVSYGNLGDVLAGRTGQNLGDVAGASQALRRAAALAHGLLDDDPADRRARFDVVNAELRVGSVLADGAGAFAEALPHYEETDRLNAALLAEEPSSDRYGYLQLVLDRRLGTALAALDRRSEAAARLRRVVEKAPAFSEGPNGVNARQQMVLSLAELAAVLAAGGDPAAAATADRAAAALETAPPQPPAAAAPAHATAARAYLTLAARAPRERRGRLVAGAVACLDRAEAAWRAAALSPALEPRRAAALDALAADRARAETLDGR